jgi:hypothetical protein
MVLSPFNLLPTCSVLTFSGGLQAANSIATMQTMSAVGALTLLM